MPMAGCTTTVASTAPATMSPSAVASKPSSVAATSPVPSNRSANAHQAAPERLSLLDAPAPKRPGRPPRTCGLATVIERSDHALEEARHVVLAPIEQHAEHLGTGTLELPLRALHLVDARAIGLDHEDRRV